MTQQTLPEPEAIARAHSERLVRVIEERIAQAGGWISFRDYMQAALYEPGLGYYSAGAAKFGADGDFVTAPEISPLFSACLAGQVAEVLQAGGGDTVLELGAGTGRMATDMLVEFDRLQTLPARYLILETSADLRERQAAALASLPAALRDRVSWLDELPPALDGVIVGNEVVDALPVQRFVIEADGCAELGVTSSDNRLVAETRKAAAPLAEFVADFMTGPGLSLPVGYCAEVNLALPAWVGSLSDTLNSGMLLLLDYGFNRQQYYLPERVSGTLRCYYRHRAHDDPFFYPGLQDITAWVDFSALAEAAAAAGLTVAGYTTQANFLLAAEIESRLAARLDADPQTQATLAGGLRKLMLPGEMGEAIKVMALTRGLADAPTALRGRDMRAAL